MATNAPSHPMDEIDKPKTIDALLMALRSAKSDIVFFRSFGACEQSCNDAIARIDDAISVAVSTPPNPGEAR